MRDDARLESARLAKVLDHPARQRIIELLGTRGSLPWKELSSELGIGTGALYYHLDTLEGIVTRDSQKKYTLTKSGKEVFAYLQQNPLSDPTKPVSITLKSHGAASRLASGVFWPRSLIYALTSKPAAAMATLIALSGVFLLASVHFSNGLSLLLLSPGTGAVSAVGSYFASLAILTAASYVSARSFFGAKPGLLPLASSCAFSLVPVMAFMAVSSSFPGILALPGGRSAFTVLLVFFQSWSATLLGAGISVTAGVRIEKAILVSLLLLYATMVFLFLRGSVA